MEIRNVVIPIIILVHLIFGVSYPQKALPELTVGFLLDGPPLTENEMLPAIKMEIKNLTEGEFKVTFPAEKIIEADWTLNGIRQAFEHLLNDPEADLVITIGSMASYEACLYGDLPKPVIASRVLDTEIQKVPIQSGSSGVPNLNYVSVPRAIRNDIGIFREIVSFEKLVVLLSNPFLKNYAESAGKLKKLFDDMNIPVTFIGVGDDFRLALDLLPEDADAVYLLPLSHLSDDQYQKIIDKLNELKLPSFSYAGAERVEQGVLAGLKKDMISRVSRRVALNIQRILLGEKPEEIPVAISLNNQLVINDATARNIGVSPPWAVVTEAEMIGEQRPIERQITLFSAVQEAVKSNLELAAKWYSVEAGRQNVNEARAQLLPSVDLSGNYVVIDEQRAAASAGQQAERTVSGSLTATQLIYSEPAWANLSVQQDLQKSRQFQLEQLKLDIIHRAATAYLNVLRLKTFERIQQENLKLTRQNLTFAQVRETVGSAGPAEVYRWESEIASNRKAVIEANSRRNLAEIQLNRLLHRPAEESFATAEIDLNDPVLITSYRDMFKFIEDRRTFKIFRQFMVEEAMKN